jgi:hypothetical protein
VAEGEWSRGGDSGGGTLIMPVTGDRNGKGEAMGARRSKMTKGNWVGGPNVRLGRTANSTTKNMAKSMR